MNGSRRRPGPFEEDGPSVELTLGPFDNGSTRAFLW